MEITSVMVTGELPLYLSPLPSPLFLLQMYNFFFNPQAFEQKKQWPAQHQINDYLIVIEVRARIVQALSSLKLSMMWCAPAWARAARLELP